MTRGWEFRAAAMAAIAILGCGGGGSPPANPGAAGTPGSAAGAPSPAPPPAAEPAPGKEPDYVTVDHILIGVRGRLPNCSRTPEEARSAAQDVLERARRGEDWEALKRKHSDDPPPGGPYTMSNRGISPRAPGEHPRQGMVPAFGDVGFKLPEGGIGLAPYDPQASPFGFHVIKRLPLAPPPPQVRASHILIPWAGLANAPGNVQRTKDEARNIAGILRDRARKGEDFAMLARQNST